MMHGAFVPEQIVPSIENNCPSFRLSAGPGDAVKKFRSKVHGNLSLGRESPPTRFEARIIISTAPGKRFLASWATL